MQTIAFYSYKGGTGRSLALANAARYLASMEFNVVALDLDLEAPGLHYKFSDAPDGSALSVDKGVVDYLHSFIQSGSAPDSLRPYIVDVPVPGAVDALLKLIPAGSVPSRTYWSRLSSLDWHDLFYSADAPGVPLFMEFKARIEEELKPDFLLIDSRTGITEMGGVATTLLADRAICIVLPTRENLDGARAILQSMGRTRRDNGQPPLQIMVALSRISPSDSDTEQRELARVKDILCEPALEAQDTLTCSDVFVLHTEAGLELRDALRVGSGLSPDDSVLLRDYLRLFASVMPAESVEAKLGARMQAARNKTFDSPEVAQKELEVLAESFPRPETYRALLQLYVVRNVTGSAMLRTAQRLWDVGRNSSDTLLWETLQKEFRVLPRRPREVAWSPRMEFVEAVWRDAGKKDPDFAVRVAEAYAVAKQFSKAADLLLDVIARSAWTRPVLAMGVRMLDEATRFPEADRLIAENLTVFQDHSDLVDAWVEHALRTGNSDALMELTKPPVVAITKARPMLAAQVYMRCNMIDEARVIADDALRDASDRPYGEAALVELGKLFKLIGRWEEFEERFEGRAPSYVLNQLRDRVLKTRR